MENLEAIPPHTNSMTQSKLPSPFQLSLLIYKIKS